MIVDEDRLDVRRSLSGKRWALPDYDDDMIARLMQATGVDEPIARLLSLRGVTPEWADAYLNPRLSQHFPDPFQLTGMRDMAQWLADAIESGRKIAIFADFDVDGASSAAVLKRFFRHLGLDVPVYIPDRHSEGFGPNVAALQSLRDDAAEIVLMADCGTGADDVIEKGQAMGLEIAVLDHHVAEEHIPAASHVINPKRGDDKSEMDMLAAVGVCYLSVVATNAVLRERGFYQQHGLEEAPLKEWLDLLALGTVCDMVPLNGPNRLFVRAGLAQMARGNNPGIAALCKTSGIETAPSLNHLGFSLGPRINAGSRVHKSWLGAELLSARDYNQAHDIAWLLHDCNEQRKAMQNTMYKDAIRLIEEQGRSNDPAIIVECPEGHTGLSGLVAGQIKERYNKPACVIVDCQRPDGGWEARGSGRSVPGVDIAAIFQAAKAQGLLHHGGGHAMAGGFTLAYESVEDFRNFVCEQARTQLAGASPDNALEIDAVLSARGVQPRLARQIQERIGPFGATNPEPVFVLPGVRVRTADIVGQNHLRLQISDAEGGASVKAMGFRMADTPTGQHLLSRNCGPVHIAGHLKHDTWNGRERAEIHIRDVAPAS